MADPISAVASIQLGFLQQPEIARETVPIAMQAQLANAQVTQLVERITERRLETVLDVEPIESDDVPDSLSGQPYHQRPSYRERRRRRWRPPMIARVVTLPRNHPRHVGSMVDVRA